MMRLSRLLSPVLALALLAGPRPARALSEAEAAAGRALAARYADMIVNVEVVATIKITTGERSLAPQEARFDPNGTVISPTGLTVTALSQIDPRSNLESMIRTRAPGQHVEIGDTEYKEVKLRRADGTEVPARVVLKDVDLDLAFIAPTEDPAGDRKPFAYVDLDQAATATVLGDYFVVTRAPKTLQRVPLVQSATLEGIDAKPRLFYIVGGIALGCPVFDGQGRTLGLGLNYFVNGRATGPIVMPAADVAEEARQAAAAKPPTAEPADDDAKAAAPPAPPAPPAPSPGSAAPDKGSP
jgi:hypothetical protein